MKPAREVAHEHHDGWIWRCAMLPGDEHCAKCDERTAFVERCRRDGAEWMREQAAVAGMAATLGYGSHLEPVGPATHVANTIRALPTEPTP